MRGTRGRPPVTVSDEPDQSAIAAPALPSGLRSTRPPTDDMPSTFTYTVRTAYLLFHICGPNGVCQTLTVFVNLQS